MREHPASWLWSAQLAELFLENLQSLLFRPCDVKKVMQASLLKKPLHISVEAGKFQVTGPPVDFLIDSVESYCPRGINSRNLGHIKKNLVMADFHLSRWPELNRRPTPSFTPQFRKKLI